MFRLFALLAVSLILAYISDINTKAIKNSGERYTVWKDWAYMLLVVILILYSGLRTDYNDTWNYVNGFRNAPSLSEFLKEPENLSPFTNPLFYLFQSFLKEFTDNGYVLIFICAVFTQICFLWFIKKYATDFVFCVFLYFTLGTFSVTMAAIKQVVAMSFLLLGVPFLEKKKWIRYYLLVFVAMLFHTYAIMFAFLPIFKRKPWRLVTFALLAMLYVVMSNFQETIASFMDQANELGKTLEDYEVFHEHGMNLLRVAVYAVVPIISFLFQRHLFTAKNETKYLLTHMSIISLTFMIMGTQGGANMFGRMAHYFEIGYICTLPWMLDTVFDKRSYRFLTIVVGVCFMGFFTYANMIR